MSENEYIKVEQGDFLYENLVMAFQKRKKVLLQFDKHSIITPTYLNCSIGKFIDVYGVKELKETLHIKGSERNINVFKQYVKDYLEIKPKRDDWPRKSHKDSILPFSLYDLHICSKCNGFALCLCSPDNEFIMSCNCNKPMTIIQLCLRDRDENGIEKD